MAVESVDPTPRDDLLDEIVVDYLEAVEAGRTPDRAALLARYPALADKLAAFFRNQDRFDALVSPLRAERSGSFSRGRDDETPPWPSTSEPLVGTTFGPYELLGELGRGGMGVVYKARDVRLGRLVALKLILAGRFASATDVRRFRAEAEAVAQIDHPNIVPVLDVGEHDGQAYFSMKLIEGGSLASALAPRSSARSPADAARLVAVVARAVQHAHERGVLHRDLKPANILLSFSREPPASASPALAGGSRLNEAAPFVADFGLAKRVTGDGPATHSGAIVGTPAYMAPEQAAGHSRTVTVAADVYGLGAILYELLTGRPPFRGATPAETLLKVLHDEPARPRQLDRRLPRDLETVCLKCLHKDPARRYPAAAALAEDLERFLEGSPVRARPASGVERFARWCLRHPVVSVLAVALAVSLAVGVVVGGLQWHRAETNLAEARKQHLAAEEASRQAGESAREAAQRRTEAEARRVEADDNFLIAHRAVNDFCLRAQEELKRSPGTQAFRRELLQAARKYYQDFVRRRGSDPALREELGDVHHHLAWITSEIGTRAEALEVHRQALVIYQELADARPSAASLQRVAASLHNIAMLENATGRRGDSLVHYEEARQIYQILVCLDPADANQRAWLANTCNSIGIRHSEAGRTLDAREPYRLAVGLREQLLHEFPNHPQAMGDLAQSRHNLGVMHERLGERVESLRQYEQARDLLERRVKMEPDRANYRADLANEYQSVAIALRDLKRRPEAQAAARKSLAIRERLAKENPSVTGYQVALAASYSFAGIGHGDAKQEQEAIDCYERARGILESLARQDPTAAVYRKDLANACYAVGVHQGNLGRTEKAREAYDQARTLLTKLVAEQPERVEYHHDLADVLTNLGGAMVNLGQDEEGLQVLREGIGEHRLAFTKAPQVPYHRNSLSTGYAALADALRKLGRLDDSAEATRERMQLWPTNGRELALAACEFGETASAVARGKTELDPSQRAERDRFCNMALDALRLARSNGYRDVEQLRKHPNLAVLRGRPEFEKLLAE
jgi:eukaryotic-like serine/threonine-protein kinase